VGDKVRLLVKAEAYWALSSSADSGDTLLDLRHAPLYLRASEFLSRLFTDLNLLPSIATVAYVIQTLTPDRSESAFGNPFCQGEAGAVGSGRNFDLNGEPGRPERNKQPDHSPA